MEGKPDISKTPWTWRCRIWGGNEPSAIARTAERQCKEPQPEKRRLQENTATSYEAAKYWPKEDPRQERWAKDVFSEA